MAQGGKTYRPTPSAPGCTVHDFAAPTQMIKEIARRVKRGYPEKKRRPVGRLLCVFPQEGKHLPDFAVQFRTEYLLCPDEKFTEQHRHPEGKRNGGKYQKKHERTGERRVFFLYEQSVPFFHLPIKPHSFHENSIRKNGRYEPTAAFLSFVTFSFVSITVNRCRHNNDCAGYNRRRNGTNPYSNSATPPTGRSTRTDGHNRDRCCYRTDSTPLR